MTAALATNIFTNITDATGASMLLFLFHIFFIIIIIIIIERILQEAAKVHCSLIELH